MSTQTITTYSNSSSFSFTDLRLPIYTPQIQIPVSDRAPANRVRSTANTPLYVHAIDKAAKGFENLWKRVEMGSAEPDAVRAVENLYHNVNVKDLNSQPVAEQMLNKELSKQLAARFTFNGNQAKLQLSFHALKELTGKLG